MQGKKLVNARVIKNKDGKLYIENTPIYTYKGRIVDEKNFACDFQEYNMHEKIIMPGLFNIHSHLGESLYKDVHGNRWTLDKYLQHTDFLNKQMSKIERKRFWEKSANITIEEMMKNFTVGYCSARSAQISLKTNIVNMSGYPIMNNIKLLEYKERGIDGFISYLNNYRSDRCSVGVFLHSMYANDRLSFELAKKCMDNGAEFITTHVSEDYQSSLRENRMHGMTAVEVLDMYKILNKKTILVHCGYISKTDMELIKERGASICICPISNLFLNTRMIDINILNEMEIPWYIGTDGLATGRTFSLRHQIRMAKQYYNDIGYQDYFASISFQPAKQLNRMIYTGNIETGTIADFIVFDSQKKEIEEIMEDFFKAKGEKIALLHL